MSNVASAIVLRSQWRSHVQHAGAASGQPFHKPPTQTIVRTVCSFRYVSTVRTRELCESLAAAHTYVLLYWTSTNPAVRIDVDTESRDCDTERTHVVSILVAPQLPR
jgi:hypothetical protein